jgi:hypothetical protein
VPIVRLTRDGGRRELITVPWGLVPFWADDLAIGNRLINARCETVHHLAGISRSLQPTALPGAGRWLLRMADYHTGSGKGDPEARERAVCWYLRAARANRQQTGDDHPTAENALEELKGTEANVTRCAVSALQ